MLTTVLRASAVRGCADAASCAPAGLVCTVPFCTAAALTSLLVLGLGRLVAASPTGLLNASGNESTANAASTRPWVLLSADCRLLSIAFPQHSEGQKAVRPPTRYLLMGKGLSVISEAGRSVSCNTTCLR